jgi:hypothetical protein
MGSRVTKASASEQQEKLEARRRRKATQSDFRSFVEVFGPHETHPCVDNLP